MYENSEEVETGDYDESGAYESGACDVFDNGEAGV
jgi:hypothetical protein